MINNYNEFKDYCLSNHLNTNQIIELIQQAFKVIIFDRNAIDSTQLLNQFEIFYNKYGKVTERPIFYETNEADILQELDISLKD